jgi:hypothetical protein
MDDSSFHFRDDDDDHRRRFVGYIPKPNHVLALYATGPYSLCGCAKDCGCGAPDVPKVAKQYNIPPEACSVIDLSNLNTFIDEVNAILVDASVPPVPLMCLTLCISFCIMSSYKSRGPRKLNELLEKTNPTMRNCHW